MSNIPKLFSENFLFGDRVYLGGGKRGNEWLFSRKRAREKRGNEKRRKSKRRRGKEGRKKGEEGERREEEGGKEGKRRN